MLQHNSNFYTVSPRHCNRVSLTRLRAACFLERFSNCESQAAPILNDQSKDAKKMLTKANTSTTHNAAESYSSMRKHDWKSGGFPGEHVSPSLSRMTAQRIPFGAREYNVAGNKRSDGSQTANSEIRTHWP